MHLTVWVKNHFITLNSRKTVVCLLN